MRPTAALTHLAFDESRSREGKYMVVTFPQFWPLFTQSLNLVPDTSSLRTNEATILLRGTDILASNIETLYFALESTIRNPE